MAKRRSYAIPVLLFFALLLLGGGAAYASGQREDTLATARKLISEARYNDAILLLTELIRRDPRRFDQAQDLLAQIDQARNRYNAMMAEVIADFNKGDLDQAYAVLQKLSELDRSPNKRTIEAEAYARATASIVYTNNEFERIMDRALPLLSARKYTDAVSLYLGGFDLGYDFFVSGKLGNIVSDQVLGLRSTLQAQAKAFIATGPPIAEAVAAASAGTDVQELARGIDELAGRMKELEAQRSAEAASAQALLRLRDELLTRHAEARSLFFLTYLQKFADGRGGDKPPEGILFAMNGERSFALSTVYDALASRMEGFFVSATEQLAAGDLSSATTSFHASGQYAALAERVSGLWDQRLTADSAFALHPGVPAAKAGSLAGGLPDYLLASTRVRADQDAATVVASLSRLGAIDSEVTKVTSEDRLRELQASMKETSSATERLLASWQGLAADYGNLLTLGYGVTKSIAAAQQMVELLRSLQAKGTSPEVALINRIASTQIGPARQVVVAQQAAVAEAQKLLAGVPLSVGGSALQATVQAKYPARATAGLAAAKGSLDSAEAGLQSVLSDIAATPLAVRSSPSVQTALAAAKGLLAEVDALKRSAEGAAGEAQRLLFDAERYRQEGENSLEAAQGAISQGNYAAAQQELAAAAGQLDRSLSYAEDPVVRHQRDSLIPELARRITDAQNDIVVREVRDYINQGKTLYSQGNYGAAQRVFLRAQARWRLTNAEDDPEITTWLQYVDTALTINSGLVISPVDPLYSEMTQVLNQAQAEYSRAKVLLANGNREEAKRLLADAQKKILYVQVPFPLNQEARVLGLRILELTEPSDFESIVRQRFSEALAKLKRNVEEGYVDLKTLSAVAPGYPGLAEAMNGAEIALGLRRPPPDPLKIRDSNDLYQKAFAIVATNIRAQYPIAIAYLNRAIELDPNNAKATALKDRLAIDTGGKTTVILSYYAQMQFRQAEEQFIAKSYYEALRIVNELLKDPANQNYSPLLDLKRRIESKI